MAYFDNVKKGDKVYGLVFGRGKVSEVFTDSHYALIAKFKNGYEVPYTEEGIPGWGNFKRQTLFYADDVDLGDADFSPIEKVLSVKKIIKHRENGKLEVRLPSGKWENVKRCPDSYIEELLEAEKFHLFRKKP